MNVSLVPAKKSDIPTLIHMEASLPKTKTYSPAVTEKEWEETYAAEKVFLIKAGETVVGNVSYRIESLDTVYISGLFVSPEHQGKGVAAEAMKILLASLMGYRRIHLVTHPENPARKLYESLGFIAGETIQNYFGDGEPRVMLSRE